VSLTSNPKGDDEVIGTIANNTQGCRQFGVSDKELAVAVMVPLVIDATTLSRAPVIILMSV